MSSTGAWLIVITFVCLLGAFVWLYGRLQRLEREVQALRLGLQGSLSRDDASAPVAAQSADAAAPPKAQPRPWPTEPHILPTPVDQNAETSPDAPVEEAVPPEPPVSRPADIAKTQDFERNLTTRWLVWLGGLTLAIAGLFLARFAVEHGILGPGPRMVLSGLFGLCLVGGGEFLLRRGWRRPVGFITADQVPVALAAAGLAILFATIYASHALHGLIGPGTAFLLLAATSLFGFPLALRHGPFVGLLAYAGGLLLPLLMQGGEPVGLGDAAWVAVLLVALFLVATRLGTVWLLIAGVVCHGLATMKLGIDLSFQAAGGNAWGIVLLILLPPMAMAALLRVQWALQRQWGPACLVAAVAAIANLFVLVVSIGFPAAIWLALLVLPGLLALLSRSEGERALLWPAGAFILICLGTYRLALDVLPRDAAALAPLLAVVLVYLLVSFAGIMRMAKPLLPALTGVSVPVVLAYAAFLLLWPDTPVLPWLLSVLGLCGLLVTIPPVRHVCAGRARQPTQAETGLAMYGAMSQPLFAILLACWLDEAALSLALALLVLAGVALGRQLRAYPIMQAAGLLASIVVGRFLLNHQILDYLLAGPVHWPLWAMGGAAAVLYLASRIVRASDDLDGPGRTTLADALLIVALTLGVSAVTLEIRVWTNGSLRDNEHGLLEVSLRTLAWMSAGLAALMPGRRPYVRIFGAVMSVLALLQILLMHMLLRNPLFADISVGMWPVLNLLTLAYLLPALMLIYARRPVLLRLPVQTGFFDALILALLLVYASLSVRQAFHGDVISFDSAGMAVGWELYSYSGLGLVTALLLILLGIRTGRRKIRGTAMAILLATVAKVFLLDMSDLSGIPRILSFLGLGFSLIGVGWIYQRFVFPRPAPPGDSL